MSELRAALADALGPLYRIEREVRPVGEYRLFVATQSQNGTELLIKVLPAALSLGINDLQFERAVLMMGEKLHHPNLVRTRGAGRAGSFVYHTRPFVAGTTLRAWLQNNRSVPLARAVEILRSVLGALAHVHAAQLAHGDLRTENVLLAEGRTVLADAGIVGAVGRSLTAGSPTAASAALCAPAYLAPGRPEGDEPATPRDDMFAVGVLVHEMLTGRQPLPDSEPLEQGRVLPPWLPELLRRCQVAKPAGRWTDAGEALAAIRRS
ncbi:MAG: protein kinase domain-containing protein [Gammaproteobacteria bacterium]